MASRATLKRLAKLKQKKHREVERLFLAEGERLVREASVAPEFTFTEPEEVKQLSTLTTPTGPVAVFPFLDVEVSDLLRKRERVLLFDGVQDPGNVGTAIRSAQAFGVGMALSAGCADLYNTKTVRSTMGSIFQVPVARELESVALIEEAKSSGFTIVVAVPSGGRKLEELPYGKVVICVGVEGSGLPREVLDACDLAVTIPAEAPSLNAAVAASILLHEAYKRVLP